MNWLKLIWIILFVALLLFPVWYVLFYIYKIVLKAVKQAQKKLWNIRAMNEMRDNLLRQKAEDTKKEIEQENKQEKSHSQVSHTNPEIQNSSHEQNQTEFKNDNPSKTNISQAQNSDTKTEEVILDEKEKKELNKIIYEADLLKKDWKLDEYEKKIIEWLSIQPDNLSLHKSLAEYYFNVWNYKKSLPLFKSIIEKHPDDHNSIRHLGQIYLVWKDYEISEALIEKAIHMIWDNPKYHISMVEIYYNTNRKLQAIWIMEKIIKLRPSNTNYMIALAELYEEVEDFNNAKKYYFRVLENEPNNEIAKKKIQG